MGYLYISPLMKVFIIVFLLAIITFPLMSLLNHYRVMANEAKLEGVKKYSVEGTLSREDLNSLIQSSQIEKVIPESESIIIIKSIDKQFYKLYYTLYNITTLVSNGLIEDLELFEGKSTKFNNVTSYICLIIGLGLYTRLIITSKGEIEL